jgi:hypothetical protein
VSSFPTAHVWTRYGDPPLTFGSLSNIKLSSIIGDIMISLGVLGSQHFLTKFGGF